MEELQDAIQETKDFLSRAWVSSWTIFTKQRRCQQLRAWSALLDDAVDALLVNDETKRNYLTLADTVDRLFKAILPDPAANQFGADRKAIVVIAEKIRSLTPPADISEVMDAGRRPAG